MTEVERQVNALKTELGQMREEVSELKDQIAQLSNRILNVKQEQTSQRITDVLRKNTPPV